MADAMAHLGSSDAESTQMLLERVLRSILSFPDAIHIQVSTVGAATVFKVRVAPEDISRLIGNDGRTIHALRMILGSIGLRHQHRFSIEIEETPE